MPRHHSALIVTACGCLLGTQAQAQTLNWTNTSGGAASLSGNWSPAAVPNASNALVWNLANTYGVTFNSFTASSLSHTYKRGTVSLNMSSAHTTGNFIVADLAGETAFTRLSSGIISATGLINVGNAATSVGTLEITGGTTILSISGTGDVNIGNGGNANLNLLNGGQLTVPDQFLAGNNSSSTSTVTVSGEQAGVRASTLNVTGTSESRIGSGGDVTMLVDATGVASFAGNLVVANGSASTSSIRLRSASGTQSAMNIAGDLSIGRNSGAAPAGNGSMLIEAGGALTVDGTVNLGNDPDGGTGLFRMSGANPIAQIGGLNIGTAGTMEIFNGSFVIAGPITAPAGYQFQIPSPGAPASSTPIVELRAGATYVATGATSIGGVAGSTGFFNIKEGSVFHQSASNFSLGSVSNGSGNVIISSGGSLQADAGLYIGNGGSAQLQLLSSGPVTCRDMDIARTIGSSGTVLVANSTLTVTDDLVVGGASNGAGGFSIGGAANLVISSGGVVNTPPSRGAYITSNGTLTINGGTMNIGGSLTSTGTFALNGGVINAPSMECYGPSSGRGAINARLFTGSNFALTGPLTLGNTASNSIDRINIDIGVHALTCIDPDVAILADSTINGGTILAANGLQLFGGATLSGTGTINADFTNLGTVTATTAAGLTFTKSVTGTAGQFGGTRIHFAPGSAYTGRNSSGAAKWHADANSTLTFTTGTSSIGDNSTDAVLLGGSIDIAGSLIINDTGGLALGPGTTLRGGGLSAIQSPTTLGRTANTRHVLRGTGTLMAVLNSSGTISPGLDEADRTGTLTFGGFYSQSVTGDTGELIMDLDGNASTAYDIVQLNGGGAVDGILRLRIGYTPSNGDRAQIIRRGGTGTFLAGTFDQLIAPAGWSLDYRADTIDVVFCASDYNADGISDFFDYLDFVADFSSSDTRADFNLDSVIDFFDYLDFVAAFSTGC